MSWEDFEVFYSSEDDITKIKQCAFVYNHLNVYLGRLCDWVQQKSDYNKVAEWLIKNDILRIVDTEESIEENLNDKTFYTTEKELWELIYKNKKRLANPPKYPKDYEKPLKESIQNDENDPFIEEILLNSHRKKFDDEVQSNYYYELIFNSLNSSEELKKRITEKFEELYVIYLRFYKKNLKDSHRFSNEIILDQFCSSYSVFIDAYEREYYEYKLTGYRDYNAIRQIRAAESMLPLVNHKEIKDFSFEDIIEIRNNRYWKNAMEQLCNIVEKIPFEEETEDFENIVRDKIQRQIWEIIENQKGKPMKDAVKSIGNLGISCIPTIGQVIGAGKTVADPLISYLQNNTKQKSLPFFLSDLRNLSKI